MRLELGYISRHENGRDFEPDDEALIFIEGVAQTDDGDASIHIKCAGAKTVARKIINAINAWPNEPQKEIGGFEHEGRSLHLPRR